MQFVKVANLPRFMQTTRNVQIISRGVLCVTLYTSSGKKKINNEFNNNKTITRACQSNQLIIPSAARETDRPPPGNLGRHNKHLTFLHIYTSWGVGAVMKLLEAVFFFFLSVSDRSQRFSLMRISTQHALHAGRPPFVAVKSLFSAC